jgi:hypothetical protein
MVIKLLHGGVRKSLILTSIIHECKIRYPQDEILLETTNPEIFNGNPDVDQIGFFKGKSIIDLDVIVDSIFDAHLMDVYSLAILGDVRLRSRRMRVFHPYQDIKVPDVVYVGELFSNRYPEIVKQIALSYPKMSVLGYSANDLCLLVNLLSQGKAFVGCAEDMSWVAMATNIPMVFVNGFFSEKHIRPFREGIPCRMVSGECCSKNECLKLNAVSLFNNVLKIKCANKQENICETDVKCEEIMEALSQIVK